MSTDTQDSYQLSELEKRHIRSHIRSNNAATVMFSALSVLALVLAFVLVDNDWDSDARTGTDTVISTSTLELQTSKDTLLIDGGDQTDLYGNPGDSNLPGNIDTPFYNPPFGNEPMVQVMNVVDGCYGKYGHVSIYVVGLTPNGSYTAQTDWTNTGQFTYGDGRYADQYGEAIYRWSCYDSQGWLLPRRAYPLHITDRASGFSTTITLIVGTPATRHQGYGPTFYVAPDYHPYGK